MTTGTNLKLTYDEANDSWSYQNVDYEYPSSGTPSWSGYTSPDPDFEFAPPPPDENEQNNDTVCPPGYIYDEILKQCLPDPNYRAPAYASEPGKDGKDDEQNYVDFREMNYDEMVDFGKKEGYFNKAGTYMGAQESNVPFPFIKGLAQFGLNSEANRWAINFAKKGGKVWNPNEGFKGNLYIPKTDDLAKFITDPSIWSNYAINTVAGNVFDTKKTTGFQIPDVRTQTSGVSEDTDKQLDLLDRVIKGEKVKQAENQTKQQEIKTQEMINDAVARSDSKTTVTGEDKGVGSRPSKDSTYLINQKGDKGIQGRRNESAYRAAIEKNIKATPSSYSKEQGGFTKGR